MALLKILKYGHPLLREKAMELKGVGARERDLIAAMAETMYAARGIGLASTQVGVMERLFVADVEQCSDDEEGERRRGNDRLLRVFINPEIIAESEEDEPFNEGCLSIPGVEGDVYRPVRLRVAARDENFEPFEEDLDGLLARVFQHELDHLNGVLFVDKLPMLKRSLVAGPLNRIKRETQEELPETGDEYPIRLQETEEE